MRNRDRTREIDETIHEGALAQDPNCRRDAQYPVV
jgi:hypothetical protein